MKINEIVCDECKAKKRGSNNWVSVYKGETMLQLVREFNEDSPLHFCGIGCAIKFISDWYHEQQTN